MNNKMKEQVGRVVKRRSHLKQGKKNVEELVKQWKGRVRIKRNLYKNPKGKRLVGSLAIQGRWRMKQ